jgi:hypothetical protein
MFQKGINESNIPQTDVTLLEDIEQFSPAISPFREG